METGGSLIYALGAMALVVSALAARRLSFGETAKMMLLCDLWCAIVLLSFSASGPKSNRYGSG